MALRDSWRSITVERISSRICEDMRIDRPGSMLSEYVERRNGVALRARRSLTRMPDR